MSSYYSFEPACDTVETGPVYPQIQKLKPGYNTNKQNSIYSYLAESESINGFPGWEPDLDSFVMHARAKPTDLVSNTIIGGTGLFVSHKLKTILEKHQLPPHRFFNAKVTYRGNVLNNYYWLHIICDLTDYIDYPASSFFIYKHFRLNSGTIEIDSKNDYIEKRRRVKEENPGINITIWSNKIHFKSQSNLYQLFEIGMFDSQLYITQDLRDDLVDQSITGCKIEKTDKII